MHVVARFTEPFLLPAPSGYLEFPPQTQGGNLSVSGMLLITCLPVHDVWHRKILYVTSL